MSILLGRSSFVVNKFKAFCCNDSLSLESLSTCCTSSLSNGIEDILPSDPTLYDENVLESNIISPSSVGLTIRAELGSFLALSNTLLTNSLSITLSSANLIKFFKGILSNSGYSSKYFDVRWFNLMLG